VDGSCTLLSLIVNNLTVTNYVNLTITVINYNVTGNIEVEGNVTADYFIGDGSLLTGLDDFARIGDCPEGYAVQNITNGTISTCYQESYNVSSSCGGFANSENLGFTAACTGMYDIEDGNWSTYERCEGNFFINYTKCLNSFSAILQVKDDTGVYNYSIPSACFNAFDNKLAIQVPVIDGGGGEYVKYRCYTDSSTTTTLGQNNGLGYFYEMAIIWNTTTGTECIPLPDYNASGYLYEESNTFYLNETLLNESTDRRINTSGGGADNLGNHIATQNLNMSRFNITDVRDIGGVNSSDLEFRENKDVGFWL